jgi:hypothetical protein
LTPIYVQLKHYFTIMLELFIMRRRHLTTDQRGVINCLVCLLICTVGAYIFLDGLLIIVQSAK